MNLINYKKCLSNSILLVIGLFVVLVVGFVSLQVVSNSFSDNELKVAEFMKENENNEVCFESCKKANLNDCSQDAILEYCTAKVSYDLDKDGSIGLVKTNAFNICEDSMYCPLVSTCSCGKNLDMDTCIDIVKQHYVDKGVSVDGDLTKIKETYKYTKGVCEDSDDFSWYNLYGIEDGMPSPSMDFVLPDIPEDQSITMQQKEVDSMVQEQQVLGFMGVDMIVEPQTEISFANVDSNKLTLYRENRNKFGNVLLVGGTYNFGPEGTYFSKEFKLRLKYKDNDLPKGYTEKEIKIYEIIDNILSEINFTIDEDNNEIIINRKVLRDIIIGIIDKIGAGDGNKNGEDNGNKNGDDNGNKNGDDNGNKNEDDNGNKNEDDNGNGKQGNFSCVDTEEGIDYYSKGILKYYSEQFGDWFSVEDSCDGGLYERYCDVDEMVEEFVECECQDGACINSSSIEVYSALDIDGDGEVRYETDVLLITRYMFGFRENSLIEGVVGNNAIRTLNEISNHLERLTNSRVLDLDMDSKTNALSDGLMIGRFINDSYGNFYVDDLITQNSLRSTKYNIYKYIECVYNDDSFGLACYGLYLDSLNKTCIDYEHGDQKYTIIDYNKKGKVDYLINDVWYTDYDACDGNLYERYCENGEMKQDEILCAQGCYDGACINQNPYPGGNWCNDNEGYIGLYIKGIVEYYSGQTQKWYNVSDSCDGGVIDFYCINNTIGQTRILCDCDDGVCIN